MTSNSFALGKLYIFNLTEDLR
ncbi:hypothetical protein EMIT0357P_20469 [Pseudomonas marginalis]